MDTDHCILTQKKKTEIPSQCERGAGGSETVNLGCVSVQKHFQLRESVGSLPSLLLINSCAPGCDPSRDPAEHFFASCLNLGGEEQSQQKPGIKSRQAFALSWSQQLLQNPVNFVQPCRFIQTFLHISAVPLTTVISPLLLWWCQICLVHFPTKTILIYKLKNCTIKKTTLRTQIQSAGICVKGELMGGWYN